MATMTGCERERLATKGDLYALETRLVEWMAGFLIAVVLAALGNLGALGVLLLRMAGG